MRYFAGADDAADVTRTLTQNLESILSGTPLTLFRVLYQIAIESAAARGYSVNVSQVSFFAPVEAVALALGVHRVTVHRAVKELKKLGLIDERAHFTTLNGCTRADGAVWCVRLRPLEGRAARLQYSDLKKQYRSLSADIAAGRTVYALMQQSKENSQKVDINLRYIRRFALPPTNIDPVALTDARSARRDLEALLDVTGAPKEERRDAVDLAAAALAAALRDSSSLNYYRRLCYALLRRYDATGQDMSYQVYLAAQRASIDAREWSGLRRPGAMLVSRLKAASWFEEMMNAPPKPLKA